MRLLVGGYLSGFPLRVVSGILPTIFFYFVEQKNVSLDLIMPLFSILREIFLTSLG